MPPVLIGVGILVALIIVLLAWAESTEQERLDVLEYGLDKEGIPELSAEMATLFTQAHIDARDEVHAPALLALERLGAGHMIRRESICVNADKEQYVQGPRKLVLALPAAVESR